MIERRSFLGMVLSFPFASLFSVASCRKSMPPVARDMEGAVILVERKRNADVPHCSGCIPEREPVGEFCYVLKSDHKTLMKLWHEYGSWDCITFKVDGALSLLARRVLPQDPIHAVLEDCRKRGAATVKFG